MGVYSVVVHLVIHDVHEEVGCTIAGAWNGLTDSKMGIVGTTDVKAVQAALQIARLGCTETAIVGVVREIDREVVVRRRRECERRRIEPHNAGIGGRKRLRRTD